MSEETDKLYAELLPEYIFGALQTIPEGDLVSRALIVSTLAFAGQSDRSGQPSILHLLRVGMRSRDEDGRVVGLLHDVVEDTPITLDHLRRFGFPEHIVEAVDGVSRRKDGRKKERYSEFIERVITTSKLAVRVKLNDISDNLERIHELPEGEGMRIRYEKAQARLYEVWDYFS